MARGGAAVAAGGTAQGQAIAAYVAGRDPVSGAAYLLALGVFTLLPWWLGRNAAHGF